MQEPVNLFVISPWQVQKALTHDVRFEKADVSYSWPGVMRVKITERRPAVYLACSYNGYAKVDYTGVVMEVSNGIKDANAPVLSGIVTGNIYFCLLYTSDAADELLCVDLGGRRIIKKKKKKNE